MHELRKDILLGRWVEVLSESKAPSDYYLPPCSKPEESGCVLCPGREDEAPPEITSIRATNPSGWRVRAIPSFRPMFQVEGDLGRSAVGIYDRMNNVGANEILVESPDHNTRPEDMGLDQMIQVVTLYRDRIADLEKDSRIRYILIYKDSGSEAGEIFSHPVSFLMATPFIPKVVKDELDNAKQYFAYKERCIFCDIINEELGWAG
jgi:UDPglucose--hexose-1-phosphate uridylyltransferase